MKTVFMPNGSRVLPLSMRYASLAFPTLSLLDLMSSSAKSRMSEVSRVIISKKVLRDCGGFRGRWVVN